jgi:hypothetical protein
MSDPSSLCALQFGQDLIPRPYHERMGRLRELATKQSLPVPEKVHFYLLVYCMNKTYKMLPLVGPVQFIPHVELKCHLY